MNITEANRVVSLLKRMDRAWTMPPQLGDYDAIACQTAARFLADRAGKALNMSLCNVLPHLFAATDHPAEVSCGYELTDQGRKATR